MTRVVRVRPEAPDPASIAEAGAVLRAGGLCAFPTETVYGLGALALSEDAVRAIFAAKGRPADNPLIVHVLELDDARALTCAITPLAERLAERFWPGPLTLVLPRAAVVPSIVTAGGDTVAVRAPSHPVARALLAEVGAPIAAPSANRSNEVSPTRAEHVVASLGDRVALVLDGGPCDRGIESTVVDATGDAPVILRPGSITRAEIEDACGVAVGTGVTAGARRSPGQLARHYAPRATLRLVPAAALSAEMARASASAARVVALTPGPSPYPGRALPDEPVGYAAGLYDALHELDARADVIIAVLPPDGDAWEGVLDRLRRAAHEGGDA